MIFYDFPEWNNVFVIIIAVVACKDDGKGQSEARNGAHRALLWGWSVGVSW